MAKLGVIESEEAFYCRFFWKNGKNISTESGAGGNSRKYWEREITLAWMMPKISMEEIRIYMRGHNLYDIFYGGYREQEQELLSRYIELAPREDSQDILDAIDRFIYFESKKKNLQGLVGADSV